MREAPLSSDVALQIKNTRLMRFRTPVNADEPCQDLFTHHTSSNTGRHDACRSCTGARGATSYWASVAANPPGHTSYLGAQSHWRLVGAPGGPARLVSLRRSWPGIVEGTGGSLIGDW